MRILVVGGGGREHALVWKLAQSPRVTELFAAPGNAGMAEHAQCVDIAASDVPRLVSFAQEMAIDLTVVGPEDALCRGIVDSFEAEGLRIFGPTSRAAELEGSKVFSKRLMNQYMIPTATARIFDAVAPAQEFLEGADYPIVIKADGLAAGKGVLVCKSRDEAVGAVEACMVDGRFGDAGRSILIEEFLQGEEASVLAFTDGKTIAVLPPARDYKRAFDRDEGPNTGGMGAYSPAPDVTPQVLDSVIAQILVPVVHAMNREGRTFRGMLYAGLMLTKGGAKVIEFNCRFGDPEAQPLLMRLKTDLVDIIDAVLGETLEQVDLEFDDRHACCVVMAAGEYPGSVKTGHEIRGLEEASALDAVQVFHAGTRAGEDKTFTAGGRVLGVTALGDDLAAARSKAYEAVGKISWDGARYREDIAS